MGEWAWIAVGMAAAAGIVAALIWKPIRSAVRAARYERARKDFHRQRERLEAKFFQLAAASGKPRGLRWTTCDFDNDVSYARDRHNGDLCAFVAVTISFEAVEGGLMEDVEAVGDLKAATAMFRTQGERWQTDGRAFFNVNPAEAIERFREDLEILGHELAVRH
jgi:hypothetical protein